MKPVLLRKISIIFLLTTATISNFGQYVSHAVSPEIGMFDTPENKQARQTARELNDAWNNLSCGGFPPRTKVGMESLRSRADKWKGPRNNLNDAFEFFSINYSLQSRVFPNGRRFIVFPPFRFNSPYRNRSTGGQASRVEPDGLADIISFTEIEIADGRRYTAEPIFSNILFAEAKTTVANLTPRSGSGNISGGSYQIGGMIDAVSRRRDDQWDKFTEKVSLAVGGQVVNSGSVKPRAIFILVGPSSTGISVRLRNFATRKQVALYKAVLCDSGGTEGVDESLIGFGVLTNPVSSRPTESPLFSPGLVGSLGEGSDGDGDGGGDGSGDGSGGCNQVPQPDECVD